MYTYIETVINDLLSVCILVGLLYAYCTHERSRFSIRIQRAGILLGVLASCAMAVVKNTTSLIATNTWNLYIFYVGILLTILFVVLSFVKRCDRAAQVVGALISADLIFYELPDVLAYPFNFHLGNNTVWSMEFLKRFIGWVLPLVVLYLLVRWLHWCIRELNRRSAVRIVLDLGLAVNAVRFFGMILSKWLARPKQWPFFVSKEHPWAFPLAAFTSNNELLYFLLIGGMALILPVWLFIRSTRVTEAYDNPAQLRKLRARNRSRRRHAVAVLVCFALCVVSLTVVHAYNNQEVVLSEPETYTITADKSEIHVAVEDVNDGHLHRFEYTTPSGVAVRWIIVKKPNAASFGIGLDACEVCGTAGYYERDGNVVCKRCDVVMNINTIGFKGGCNPIPLSYRIENGEIIFDMEDILASESNF